MGIYSFLENQHTDFEFWQESVPYVLNVIFLYNIQIVRKRGSRFCREHTKKYLQKQQFLLTL